jgi:hypothetical protein
LSQNVKAHLALLGANVIYGLNYVIAKGIMPDYLMPKAILIMTGVHFVTRRPKRNSLIIPHPE